MQWLSQNWFWLLFGLAFVGMHFGHGGHGGHGNHGRRQPAPTPEKSTGNSKREGDDTPPRTGHSH